MVSANATRASRVRIVLSRLNHIINSKSKDYGPFSFLIRKENWGKVVNALHLFLMFFVNYFLLSLISTMYVNALFGLYRSTFRV